MTSVYLAIVGPTATGKTDLGLRLAKEQDAEIISVDSRQVYKYLSVGTAKPKETGGIPYHLIDFLEPDKNFSAADFMQRTLEKIGEIEARGKKVIFVGGTGLYFKTLTEGLADLPPADPAIRDRLKKQAEDEGRPALHARLLAIDPLAAARIPANNIQRVIRALEVFELTGKPISAWHAEHQDHRGATVALHFMGIDIPREEHNRRIQERCAAMLDGGMIEETRALLDRGIPETCPALSGLGYPRVIAYLKGAYSKAELLQLLSQDTRQYAKRQRTWFRNQLPVKWETK
jgi:tRNA dimethylallyltransferase